MKQETAADLDAVVGVVEVEDAALREAAVGVGVVRHLQPLLRFFLIF